MTLRPAQHHFGAAAVRRADFALLGRRRHVPDPEEAARLIKNVTVTPGPPPRKFHDELDILTVGKVEVARRV
jgi:hypothetical protein